MQDKYTGDIGDFAKFSLLRALTSEYLLGVSWYLFPDEGNNDGRYIDYLNYPKRWRQFDVHTFDALKEIVEDGRRRVYEIERCGLLPANTVFFNTRLDFAGCYQNGQADWRKKWFTDSLKCLEGCELVFADPDNGLKRSEKCRPGQRKQAKSISEREAKMLADGGRPTVIYHHNSRFRGGHEAEVRFWQERLGMGTYAVRWRLISARTFFILNCSDTLALRAARWCERWKTSKVALVTPPW